MFKTFEELELLEENYNVEDNGMSGQHYGYHWYTLTDEDGEEQDVYVK